MGRTEKGGRVLENLNHAKELGTPLTNFATAFKLNVNDLYAARRSCGFWAAKRSDMAKPALLAVEVAPEPKSPDRPCRLTRRSGWTIECASWPAPN